MANNGNRINSLLVAKQLINKQQQKNQNNGIYTAEQKNAYFKAQQAAKLRLAAAENRPNKYVDDDINGGIERVVKQIGGDVITAVPLLGEALVGLNPWVSGSQGSMSPAQVRYAKQDEAFLAANEDVKATAAKIYRDFPKAEADRRVAALVAEAEAKQKMSYQDAAVGKQALKINPMASLGRFFQDITKEPELNDGSFASGAEKALNVMSGNNFFEELGQNLEATGKDWFGAGFDSGMTTDEAIIKQQRNRRLNESYDKDAVGTDLGAMFSGELPSIPNLINGTFSEGRAKDTTIFGSPTNRMYEDKYINERDKTDKTLWDRTKTQAVMYGTNPGRAAETVAGVVAYAIPGIGEIKMAGDIQDVNARMKARAAEKAGTNYLDSEDSARILQNTLGVGLAMKVGLDNARGMAKGGGLSTGLTNVLASKTPQAIQKVAKPVLGITGNAITEGVQEVTELAFEKAGTQDKMTDKEIAESFVAGAVGGGGMSTVGKTVAGVSNKISGASNKFVKNESELLDPTHKNYNPSEAVRRASAINGANVSEQDLNTAKTRIDNIRNNVTANVTSIETELANRQKFDELKAIVEDSNSSPEAVASARETLQGMVTEFGLLGQVDELTEKLNKAQQVKDKTDTEYFRNVSRLDDLRVSKEYDEFSSVTKTNAEEAAASPEVKTAAKTFSVKAETLDSTSTEFAPTKAIKELNKQVSIDSTDAELDGVLVAAKESLAKVEAQAKAGQEDTTQLKELEGNITLKQNAIEDRERRIKSAKDSGIAASLQVELEQDKKDIDALINKFTKLQAKVSKSNPAIANELVSSQKEVDNLTKYTTALKRDRAKIISGLTKHKDALEGKTDPVSVKELEDINDKLEDMTNGKLSDSDKVTRNLKRDYDKAVKNKATVDKAAAVKVQASKDLDKAKEAVKTAKENNSPKAIIKRLEAKVVEAQDKYNEVAKRVSEDKVTKAAEDVITAKAKMTPKEEPKESVKTKESDAVTTLKDNIKASEEKLSSLKTTKAGLSKDDSSVAAVDSMIEKVEEAIAIDNADLKELTGKEEATKATKTTEAKSGNILTRRLRSILNSPSAMGIEITPNTKAILRELARELDALTAQENILKDTNKVSNDILYGSAKYLGLRDYEAALATAVENKDIKEFNLFIGKLKSFTKGHNNKAVAMEAAAERFATTKKEQVVYRVIDSQTEWAFKDANLFEANGLVKVLRKTGSLLVNEKSTNLIVNVTEEAEALSSKLETLMKLQDAFVNPIKVFVPNEVLKAELGSFIEQDAKYTNQTSIKDIKSKTNKTNDKESGAPSSVTHTFKEIDGKLADYLNDHVKIWMDSLIASNSKVTRKTTDSIVKNYRAIAKAANKSIAFGHSSKTSTFTDWEAAFNEDFTGMNNTITFNKSTYTSDDVVAVIRNESNDTVEIARARKAELDAAIEAGATLLIPHEAAISLKKINAIVKYITDNGYKLEVVRMPLNGNKAVNVHRYTKDVNVTGDNNNNKTSKPTPKKDKDIVDETTENTDNTIDAIKTDIEEESGLLDLDNTKLTQRDTVLNGQKNLFSKLIASKDYVAIAEMVGFELTESNKKQLNAFIRLHKQISDRVSKAIKDPKSTKETKVNPLYQNLVTTAENGSVSVPENVVTAMTLSLFQYIQTNGRNSYLDEETWRKVHKLEPWIGISHGVKKVLSEAGSHRAYLFQELGTGATRALGLGAGQESEFTILENLQSSLGALTYAIVNEETKTPMFVEKKLTKLEQVISIVQGMDLYTAKKYLEEFAVSSLFNESDLRDKDMSEVKTVGELVNILKSVKATSNTSALNKTIILSRADITNTWNKGTKTSTTTMHKDIQDIFDSSSREDGSKDVLDKIFNSSYERVEPLDTKPESFDQKTVIKGTTEIAENMQEALLKQSQHEWGIQESKSSLMLNLYDSDRKTFHQVLGVKTDADIELLHPTERDEALTERNIQIDLLDKQVAWLKGREVGASFWHKPAVWVNQRVGYASTLFNAQTNMFARMLSTMKAWETKIDTTQEFMTGNKVNLHGRFFLALAESMEGASKHMDFEGTKYRDAARTVDKVKPQDFIHRFVGYLETSPVIADAVASVRKMKSGEVLTTKDREALTTAIKELAMDELGLGALMEYTNYLDSKDSGSYTTQMGSQSDGITNGPMITKFLLAVADTTTKKMGGILSKTDVDNGIRDFLDTKALGEMDLYEDTGKKMLDSLISYITKDSFLTSALVTIKLIDADFGSRSWAKKLLTPFNYGAGIKRLREAINFSVVDKFQSEYFAIYHEQDSTKRQAKLETFNNKLETIVTEYNKVFVHQVITEANQEEELDKLIYIYNSNKTTTDHVETTGDFTTKALILMKANNKNTEDNSNKNILTQLNNISNQRLRRDTNTLELNKIKIGEIEEALPTKYIDAVTQLSNITYATAAIRSIETHEVSYIAKRDLLQKFASNAYRNYAFLRQLYTQEFAKDPNNVTKKEQALIDKELNKHKAAVPSAMSNLNRDNEGKRKPGTFRTGIDLEKVTFQIAETRNIPFNVFTRVQDGASGFSYSYGYHFKTIGDPGIRTLALMIQSLDSAVSIQALADFVGMNFHDANVFGLNQFEDGVRKQNESFFDAVIKYEPSVEIAQAKLRPLYRLREMLLDDSKKDDVTTARRISIKDYLSRLGSSKEATLKEIEILYGTEIAKLEASIANDAVIHQYGGIGGQFEVTKEQRDFMQKRIKELRKEKAITLKKYAHFVDNFDKVSDDVINPKTETDLMYEEIAELDAEHRSNLLKRLAKKKDTTVNDLIGFITETAKAANGGTGVLTQMLTALQGLADSNLSSIKIQLVGKDFINKSSVDSTEGNSVRYSKFKNSIVINTNVDLLSKDLIREIYVAAMHQNLITLKNGSNNNPELSNLYRGLKTITGNISNIIRVAENNKSITEEDSKILLAIFDKKSNTNNVELLMNYAIYDETVRAILDKITYKDINGSNTSLLAKVKEFLLEMFNTNKDSLGKLLFDSSTALEKGVLELRQTKTINQMITDSFASHVLPFSTVNVKDNIEAYETRFQLEMRKLKIKHGSKGIPIQDVLNLMQGAIATISEDGQEAYHSLLKPVIGLLKSHLDKGLKVVLVDEQNDLLEAGFPTQNIKQATDDEQRIINGHAFFDNSKEVNKVVFYTSNVSDSSVLRMSVMVHELIHGLTMSMLLKPLKEQSSSQQTAMKSLDALRQLAVNYAIDIYGSLDKLPYNINYGLTGDNQYEVDYKGQIRLDEFVAQIFSSKEMRDFLVKVPVTSNKNKNKDTLTETYETIEAILGTNIDTLKTEPAVETTNALRNFGTIFSGLLEETKAADENRIEQKDPVALTDTFIGIQSGLSNLGVFDQTNNLANELIAFNNGVVKPTLERYLLDVNKAIASQGLTPTEATVVVQPLNSPTQYVVDLVTEANEVIEARQILSYEQDQAGQARQSERHAPKLIADFLGKHSTRDNSYLNNIIRGVINPLVDNISPALVEGYGYEKVWHDAIVSGKDVYSSKANEAGFNLDDQQSYVLEVLEIALLKTLDSVNNSGAFRQLEKTYTEAKNSLSVRDFHQGVWSEATAEEQEIAESKYNFIFRPAIGSVDGKSDYLTNFMSLVLVSPEVKRIMNISTVKQQEDSSWFNKLVTIFDSIVEYWEGKANNFNLRDTVSNKVDDLSRALADVYYKNLDIVIEDERGFLSRTEDHLADLGLEVLDRARKGTISVLNIPFIKGSPISKTGVSLLEGRFKDFDILANNLFDFVSPNKQIGNVRETINETLGTLDNPEHKDTLSIMRVTKAIEQERGNVIDSVSEAMQAAFSKENKELTEEENKGISNTLLRTDVQSLTSSFSFNEIVGLIKDKTILRKETKATENELKEGVHGAEYISRAKDLANYMVHRKSTSSMLAKNALSIADRVGLSTKEATNYSETTLENIDKLVSLYALELTKSTDKKAFLVVLAKEASNENSMNGLEYLLNSHRDFAQESYDLFAENPYSMTKGYLPNLVNPNKGFEVIDKKDVALYESLGFKRSSDLMQSPLDTLTSDKVIMTVSNNGKQRLVSGALSLEDTGKSGTTVVRRGEKAFAQLLHEATKAAYQETKVDRDRDLSKTNLVPSYDADGSVISFSYEMSHVALDTYLERDNTATTLLSQMKGANLSKKAFPSQNKRIVDYLNTQYDNSDARTKNKFVLVSANSTDKKIRDKWNSLPKETQLYIENTNGEKAIYMRNDEMNLLFGFRKFNPGDAFDKNALDRNLMEAFYTGFLSGIPGIGSKAQLVNNQVLTFWLELIRTFKDYIVVRGLKVLWANIKSNATFLMLNASDPLNAFKDIKDGLVYSMKYQRDKHELTILKHELRIGLSDPKRLSRYVELTDTVARNPLADFIEAGMMPTIVNDISFKKGEMSYKTGFDTFKDNTIGRLPKKAQKGLDYILVAPGTPIYSFLSNATQQSDFVFKYALYKQELRKGNSKQDSMDVARQVFIEYDVPTNQAIQFVNDIGLWMFTKFALRIQRVLMHYARTRPGKLLLEHVVSAGIFNNPSLLSLNLASNLIKDNRAFDMPGGAIVTMTENALPMQLIASVIK